MPLGNGDIGINLWAEKDGSISFYVGKTDSWSENGRLLKLGLVKIKLDPNPFAADSFEQILDLQTGSIKITSQTPQTSLELLIWVDANRPVIRVQGNSSKPIEIQAQLHLWRQEQRQVSDAQEMHSFCGQNPPETPYTVYPDTVADTPDRITWYHRNESSMWAENLRFQALQDLAQTTHDPLLNLTFGATILGHDLEKIDSCQLRSKQAVKNFEIAAFVLTAQTDTADQWLTQLEESIDTHGIQPSENDYAAHCQWWAEFWSRSFIEISGHDQAQQINQAYNLQRFMVACAGRGKFPIKFNGSIFNVDWNLQGECFDPDYRRWGGGYWFQNTRLIYWPMLQAGDCDLIKPFFDMYLNALPLAQKRTQKYFNCPGAFFPETMNFWGTYLNQNYGFDRTDKHCSYVQNTYIRRYWQGGLELTSMMLDYVEFTQDTDFLQNQLLPFADNILKFYHSYYSKLDDNGKIIFQPAQSLETWHDAVNPLPVIAGLKWVLTKLQQIPSQYVAPEKTQWWMDFLDKLPPLPTRTYVWEQKTELLPALQYDTCSNSENPELYAVFPYRLYGIGKPNLETALVTWENRRVKRTGCWTQDPIQAALLGLTEQVQTYLIKNATTMDISTKHPKNIRLSAFVGPNFDWIPDMDHGGVTSVGLQQMLMQCEDSVIRLLPAWPKDWNVNAKLHAPKNTTVQFSYQNGKITQLNVNPDHRKNDIIIEQTAV